MASQAATTPHYLQLAIQWASIALLWYDYALTLPMEVKYIWRARLRLSTFLYILCRYALLANVLYLLALEGVLTQSCDTWYKVVGALSVLGRAAVIVTFTGRVYAVWGKNRIILAYLASLGIACIGIDIAHVPGLKCVNSSRFPILDHLLTVLMVVFEFSSAVLTTIRCIQAFRSGTSSWRFQKGGLSYVIFEEGILYFSVMSVFTTTTLVLIYRAPTGFLQRLLNALTLPLSGLLTARFLLHVRRWDHKRSNGVIFGDPAMSLDSQSCSLAFRASPAGSSIVDDFGTDPVARVAAESLNSGNTSFNNTHFIPSLSAESVDGEEEDEEKMCTDPAFCTCGLHSPVKYGEGSMDAATMV